MSSRDPMWFVLCCVVTLMLATQVWAQDAAAGERLFKADCGICPGRILTRPSLFVVVDRPSGQIPNFHYSDANKKSGLTWSVATLDRYLTAPRELVPGTKMVFAGIKDAKQRANLIAYLATLR